MTVEIRAEAPGDVASIRVVTAAAFENAPFSNQTEAAIVDALRHAGALSLSLVATDEGELVGHVAFSPVLIEGQTGGWYGLGPVSVRPDRQRQGIGKSLITRGIEELRGRGAAGAWFSENPAIIDALVSFTILICITRARRPAISNGLSFKESRQRARSVITSRSNPHERERPAA